MEIFPSAIVFYEHFSEALMTEVYSLQITRKWQCSAEAWNPGYFLATHLTRTVASVQTRK
jgi:hypothetical protein